MYVLYANFLKMCLKSVIWARKGVKEQLEIFGATSFIDNFRNTKVFWKWKYIQQCSCYKQSTNNIKDRMHSVSLTGSYKLESIW